MIDKYTEFEYPDEQPEREVEGEEVLAMMVEALKVFGGFINDAKTMNGIRLRNWAVWRVVCPTVINHETQSEFARRIGVSKKHVNNYVAKVRRIKAEVESRRFGNRGSKR